MEILCDAVDYGDAPSFVATGVCRVFFLSRNIVRVTFCRRNLRDDGEVELRVCGHVDWDVEELRAAHAAFNENMAEILAEASRQFNRPVKRAGAAH